MTSESISKGMHYKKYVIQQKDAGQPLDPAFIAAAMAESGDNLSAMRLTILKKVLRMGKGDKSKEQDLYDIIGAAKRELSLLWRESVAESGGLGEHGFFRPNADSAKEANNPCNNGIDEELDDYITQLVNGARNPIHVKITKITPAKPEKCFATKKGFVELLTDELVKLVDNPSVLLTTNLEYIAKEARNEIIDISRGIAPTPCSVIANDNGIEGVLLAVFGIVESLAMELNQHASKAVIAVITENAVFRALDAIGNSISGGDA